MSTNDQDPGGVVPADSTVHTIDLLADDDGAEGAVEIAQSTQSSAAVVTVTATIAPEAAGVSTLADVAEGDRSDNAGTTSAALVADLEHATAAPQAVATPLVPTVHEAVVLDDVSGPQARTVHSSTKVLNPLEGDDEGGAIEIGAAGQIISAPAVSAAPTHGKFDIEPSAVSIPPDVLAIEHPTRSHVVLVVDLEPRRSRERYSTELPPEPRPPLVVELTGEAQLFGRKIHTLCTDFDRFSSGMHGAFQKDEVTGQWHVRDMSDKGVKLNGRYIERGDLRKLNDGAVLTFGLWTKIIFFQGDDGALKPTET